MKTVQRMLFESINNGSFFDWRWGIVDVCLIAAAVVLLS